MSTESSSIHKKTWGPVAGVVLGFLAYKVPEWIIANLISQFPLTPNNTNTFIVYGLFEAMTIGAVLMLVTWYYQKFSDIGVTKFKGEYIVKAVVGFCSYFALTLIITHLVGSLFDIPDQKQSLGFVNPSGIELALAFVALVVVVPFAEELLFRGFIYKGIRSAFSFSITTAAVSILFAVAHGQWNVGLDVFALSIVLCYLREKTGSIWPGVLLHAFKNGIAFLLLFIYNVQ